MSSPPSDRRTFLSTAAAATTATAAGLNLATSAHAAGSEEIKIALVGCGGRGTGAANQALKNAAGANVKLVALADAFGDRLESCYKALASRHGEKVDVPAERRFVGLDAYQKAIDCGVDMVLLCAPPGFRPVQFEAAVKAGKHVFMEKPVATDAPGVRQILATNKIAKDKGLLVAVGHHLRHEKKHIEPITRVHDGEIGDVHTLRVYFNSSGVWVRRRKPEQSEMEYQVQNWYYFTWLSGDHIVEQHVHDIDVGNWIMQDAHPVEAQGVGGRQVRIGKDYGEIFDHHTVEFTYANGAKMFSFCRHMPGCWGSFSEHAQGSKGEIHLQGHGNTELLVDGKVVQKWRRETDGHQTEQDNLFKALLAGEPYNEVEPTTASTMTAILGRLATYSGRIVTWDDAFHSDIKLVPEKLTWDAPTPVKPRPDGLYNCALPGLTRVV